MGTLGERIKDKRLELEMSVAELARQAGISKPYLWEIENKGREKVAHDKVLRIAKALNISFYFLATGHEPEKTCEECEFFVDTDITSVTHFQQVKLDGDCQRFPRKPVIGHDFYQKEWLHWVYPRVCKTDTCGEWHPKGVDRDK